MLIVNFIRLGIFATMLLYPFLRVGWAYFQDRRVHHGVRFGDQHRQRVDIYCPVEAVDAKEGRGPPLPIVVAIMGGAWVLGNKAWNAQLGLRLMDAGIIVFALDYRNFPCSRMPTMLADLDAGISWVFKNAASWGGDVSRVVLTGQSAGAHLASVLLVDHCVSLFAQDCHELESDVQPTREVSATWSPKDFQGFVGVSGVYDLPLVSRRLEDRWVGSGLLRCMCPGGDLERYSPTLVLRRLLSRNEQIARRVAEKMPPSLLFHGARDKTVPISSSTSFAEVLRESGAEAVAEVSPNLAHAEVIIEGPMRGEDHQIQLLMRYLFPEDASEHMTALPQLRPMFPICWINLASYLMPF